MKQKKNNSVASLVDAGMKISAGAATHAAGLGLVVATKPLMDAEVTALTTANTAHLSAKGVLRDRMDELENAVKRARGTALLTRDILRRVLGQDYSPAWNGTGFSGSLEVPKSPAKLADTLRGLKGYFADHPEFEKVDVATALIVGMMLDALTAAITAATVQRGEVRTLMTARRTKERLVRARISGTVNELKRVIGPLDGRWDAFGLNQPGIKAVPPVPEGMSVVTNVGGKLTVKWPKAARTDHYRIWLKVIGVDEGANPFGSVAGLSHTIESLAAGTQVEASLSAVNNGGESLRSTPLVVTMQ